MSHVMTFSAEQLNFGAVKITAERMGYRVIEKAQLDYDGRTYQGLGVYLPDWSMPVVITDDGKVHFDNYSDYVEGHPDVVAGKARVGEDGRWGDIKHLDRFVNECLATQVMLTAQAQGHVVQSSVWDPVSAQIRMRIAV